MSVPTPIMVVGDVINDVLVRPLTAVTHNSDTRSEIVQAPGGSAANLACWIAALDAPVYFVGRVGADIDYHRQFLEEFGVKARLVEDPKTATGTIIVILDQDGKRTMYTDRGANLALSLEDIDSGILESVGLLHLSGYSFFEEPVRTAAQKMLMLARDLDVATSVDPSSSAFLSQKGPERFLEWTQGATYAFPNQDEAEVLTGLTDPMKMAEQLTETYKHVVITLESHGCAIASRGHAPVLVPVNRVKAVDTTGAGDSFSAGFLAFLSRRCTKEQLHGPSQETLRGAVQYGAKVAARVVQRFGARPQAADTDGDLRGEDLS